MNTKPKATYDTIKPTGGGGITPDVVPPGRYEAILNSATLQEPTEKVQSLRLNFELCTDELATNDVPTWFKFYQADMSTINEFGVGMWKATLAKLQYEDVKEDDLPQLLEQISEDKPGVIVKISYQNVKGTVYPRVEVEGPCDNDVVAQWRETHQSY